VFAFVVFIIVVVALLLLVASFCCSYSWVDALVYFDRLDPQAAPISIIAIMMWSLLSWLSSPSCC
jgi:hypothetical protein